MPKKTILPGNRYASLPPFFLVFDVESIGLHGNSFAVGWVVLDADGKVYEEGSICTRIEDLHPDPRTADDFAWVKQNVFPAFPEAVTAGLDPKRIVVDTPEDMRTLFWSTWLGWRNRGAWLAADVPWPVESLFLCDCVMDEPARKKQGPYPIVDVATVRLSAGLDPLASEGRLVSELPVHHPLADARQSARLLLEALRDLRLIPKSGS